MNMPHPRRLPSPVRLPLSALLLSALLLSALPLSALPLAAQEAPLDIDPELHHLGDSVLETWSEVPAEPEGNRLDLEFGARRNAVEHVLELRQRDVDNRWTIELNGASIGALRTGKASRVEHYIVPPGALRNGRNELSFVPSRTTDDIVLGAVRLHREPLRSLLKLQPVVVRVADSDGGAPLPAKVTVVTAADQRAARLYDAARPLTAVRPGICYTADGAARFTLPPGDYGVFATRGTEWGLAAATLELTDAGADAAARELELRIGREVDTSGWIACDSHIHTLTHSGHGDSSVEERMVTLAGEGVELAIATDHNHNTGYRPTQRALGLDEHFTPVVGNEVTTAVGHMNAFPLEAGAPVPDHELEDWIKLAADIRSRGAQVVVLNHPRWPQIPTGPFGEFGLSRLTGELPGQRGVPFDGMELVNSTALQPDFRYLFVDWFALLNHGVEIHAVGTSDSHTVGDPVGQGRSYVPSRTDDPARIDVAAACAAFVEGRVSVSLGIFCDVTVNGERRPGDLAAARDGRVGAALRVAAPSWVRPRRALAFLNGVEVARQPVPATADEPTDLRLAFDLEVRAHDAHLVFVVRGDGVSGPYWPTEKPYTLAATNPVWIDGDGDGQYRSPRETGEQLARAAGDDAAALRAALADVDDAVAVQALHAARLAWEKDTHVAELRARVRARLAEVAGERAVLREYVEDLDG